MQNSESFPLNHDELNYPSAPVPPEKTGLEYSVVF